MQNIQKLIKNSLIQAKERLEIIEGETADTDFIKYQREDSISKLKIAKRHIETVVGKLESGAGSI